MTPVFVISLPDRHDRRATAGGNQRPGPTLLRLFLTDFTSLGKVNPYNLNVLYHTLEFRVRRQQFMTIFAQGLDQIIKINPRFVRYTR